LGGQFSKDAAKIECRASYDQFDETQEYHLKIIGNQFL
jgi:hypothetical protein